MGSDQGEPHRDGAIYGGRSRLRLPRDRPLRIALAVGGTGMLLGAVLASGALSGDGPTGRWVDPAGEGPAGPGGTAAGAGQPPGAGDAPGTGPPASPAAATGSHLPAPASLT